MKFLKSKSHVLGIFLLFLSFFVIAIVFACKRNFSEEVVNSENENIDKFYDLKKVGEIKEWIPENENDPHLFWQIDSIYFDDENNFYVSDSGWNRIFKFTSHGEYIRSIGSEGQGPGEFLADPGLFPLLISFGNDGNLYVNDVKNRKISIFTPNGKFIKQFFLPYILYDSPQVNSNGEIYLISKRGDKIIDLYDKDLNIKSNFLSIKKHLDFSFFKYKQEQGGRTLNHINDMMLQKIITKKNRLVVFSNISLTAFYFDKKNKIEKSILINAKSFIDDFRPRLKKAINAGGFVAPFRMTLDSNGNLCLLYFNRSIMKWIIYRYSMMDGAILDILKIPEEIQSIFCFDNRGYIYAVNINGTSIGIYKI